MAPVQSVFAQLPAIITGVTFYWCISGGAHFQLRAEGLHLLGVYLESLAPAAQNAGAAKEL